MPRSREPADVFYATDQPNTPPAAETPPTTPTSPKKRAPKPTPPGPINLEIRTSPAGQQTKIACTQRVYSYNIDQTDDTITITGNLRPDT